MAKTEVKSKKFAARDRHYEIPACKWGITKGQFIEFMDVVRSHYKVGAIRNIGRPYDKAKFNDPKIGPNMYQINDQIIKPLTKGTATSDWTWRTITSGCGGWSKLASKGAIPKTSWSLMKNPKGIAIDLFVSHAWGEGVFEFESHLLEAWPEDCQAAYICFLSNPQNLGNLLNEMLEDINRCPFRKALAEPTMKEVIMLASENLHIHERVWCCFEAFVAMDLGLPVKIAGNTEYLSTQRKRIGQHNKKIIEQQLETRQRLEQIWSESVAAFIAKRVKPTWDSVSSTGKSQRGFLHSFFNDIVRSFYFIIILLVQCLAIELLHGFISTKVASFSLFYGFILAKVASFITRLLGQGWLVFFALWLLLYVTSRIGSVLSSLFLLKYKQEMQMWEDSLQLNEIKKYAVDVKAAEATNQSDKDKIMAAIGDRVDEVNYMITQIISQGNNGVSAKRKKWPAPKVAGLN